MKMKTLLLALVGLLVAASASAQVVTPAITFVTLNNFRPTDPSTGPPFKTQSVVWAPLTFCNKPPSPPVTGTVVNPSTAEFGDPDPTHVGKVCQINFAVYWQQNLVALTGYTATTSYTYADSAVSGASNVSNPFDEQPGHPAPVGLGVR